MEQPTNPKPTDEKLAELDDDEREAAKRRRRGETEGEFGKLARKFSRHFVDRRKDFRARAAITGRTVTTIQIPAEAYEAAGRYLADTLDQLNQLNDAATGCDFENSFAASADYISLHL